MTARIGIVAATLVVLGACGSSGTTAGTDGSTTVTTTVGPVTTTTAAPTSTIGPDASEQAALDEARARWHEAALADYTYVLQRFCECSVEWSAPHTVVVRNGEVVHERLDFGTGDPEAPAPSIDAIFDQIQEAIDRGSENAVTYDGVTGAPEQIDLDLPAIAVDGGFSMAVELTDQTEPLTELAAAEQRWADAGIADYELRYQVRCFCPRLVVTSVVVGGGVESFTVAGGTSSLEAARTVEDLFDIVRDAYDTGAASVSVTYSADTGYPIDHFVDEYQMMMDEEHGATVLSFTPTD